MYNACIFLINGIYCAPDEVGLGTAGLPSAQISECRAHHVLLGLSPCFTAFCPWTEAASDCAEQVQTVLKPHLGANTQNQFGTC